MNYGQIENNVEIITEFKIADESIILFVTIILLDFREEPLINIDSK